MARHGATAPGRTVAACVQRALLDSHPVSAKRPEDGGYVHTIVRVGASSRCWGDDKERVDRADPGVVELQDIAGPDVVRVVPEEGPPGLAVLPARTDGPHVLLDRPLAHADAEREQFAADPFGAPQPVGSGHGLDQVDELHAQPPPCPPPPGRMVPEEGEQVAMPAEEGVGLDHREGIAPRGVQPGQEHQDKPGLSVEAWARWRRASEYEDLLAEERVLGDKRRAGPDGVDTDRAHQRCPSADGPQHVLDGPATFVDASTDGRLDGPGQPVQHAGLLSHRGLGSRGRGTRFSQQRLTALRRKPLLCEWTGQVASTRGSEVVLGCEILNRMTALGRPVSYRIGR